MKRTIIAASFVLALGSLSAQKASLPAIFKNAEKQTAVLLKEVASVKGAGSNLVSPRTVENNALKMVASSDWTSGFFPGILWYLYEYTGDKKWRAEAEKFTTAMEKEKTNGGTHDMGFKIYCSFGNGYRLTNNPQYKAVIIQAAKTLSTRFNETAGVIKSWDNRKEWKYPVIVDNMMNLELLFTATRFTGDSSFYRIAVSHAHTTLKNHFRADNSSFHVLDYDTVTGKVVAKATHQGFSDGSAWARGQAWGLYGYTMSYRETRDTQFLAQAERIARFILDHPRLPKDGVPYWDYDAANISTEPRDASAAAITASALFELSTYTKGKNAKEYRAWAQKILNSLTANYRSRVGENKGFLLVHSTGHKPAKSEVDVPIAYADYYYLEALLRSRRLK
jgi:rhamnogalacturonyl hydrolase YesR